ncbi:hypothetical protein PMAYCL1PPCAC_16155, partial [Pristionchus mayeri]
TKLFASVLAEIIDDFNNPLQVVVRYTTDGWRSQRKLLASFSHKLFGNHDIDVFCFALAVPYEDDSLCEMCVSYFVSDATFWDNNDGENYRLEWIHTEQNPAPSPVLIASSYSQFRFLRNLSDEDLMSQ